ncbi:MAG TPA: glycosyltransferase family 39 protein [Chthoniobacterales bacterium]|nr:glycosyltransferase family 39 protein [Chthoniobacterales bacterium]
MTAIDTKWHCLILAVITLTAGWLRFSSINFGLPDHLRPDEERLVPRALGVREEANVYGNPAVYPDGQILLVHGVLRSYAMLTGAGQDLRLAYARDNGARAFSIARLVTAAMGTATVLIVYLAAASIYGPVAALVSSALLAVSFIHVRDSKFAKMEIPAGFWLALSVLTMLRIPGRGRLIDYGLAGLFCGLAAATHYPSGAIAIGILVAHLEARRREGKSLLSSLFDPRIYVAGVVSIVAFLAADPSFILEWNQTVRTYIAMRHDFLIWNGGNTPAGFGWPWLLRVAMPRGFGIELEILLLAALLWVFVHRKPGTLALLAFVLVCFWSLTSTRPQLEIRYLINPLLAMVLLAGVFVSEVVMPGLSRIGVAAGRTAAIVGGVILLGHSFIRDLQMNYLLRQTDTRTIARQWMIAHTPQGSSVAMMGGDGYGKPKFNGLYHIIIIDPPVTKGSSVDSAGWVVSDSAPQLSLWSKGLSDAAVAELNAKGTLEFDVDPFRPGAAAPVFDPNDAFYIPFYNITSMMRPGPAIRIWKLTTPPSQSNG